MAVRYSKYLKLLYSVGDLFLLNAASLICSFTYQIQINDNPFISFTFFSSIAWLAAGSVLNSNNSQRVTGYSKIANSLIKHLILYILLIESFLNFSESTYFTRNYLTYYYLLITLILYIWRIGMVYGLKLYRSKGYNNRRIIFVGYSKTTRELYHFFCQHPEYGYKFIGYFDNNPAHLKHVLGKVEDVEQYVLTNDIDEIYCSPKELNQEQIVKLIDFADNNLIRLKFLPDTSGYQNKKFQIDFYDLFPVIIFRKIPLDDILNQFLKRSFDIIFSTLIIVLVLSWLLPLLAILIKLDSKGPVFFKQQRSGINNNIFWCWKLRTMYTNVEAHVRTASRNDARITRIGAFLRKTSLDELPQFFNVFIGNMSTVGPRPHMLKVTEEYAQVIDKFMVRHFIKPGITGLSQVMGYRGDTTDNHKMKGRVKIDIFYLENWSFLLDMKIVFLTIYNIFRGEENAI